MRDTTIDEPSTPEHILQVGLGFWASKTLLSAVELGVFTELAAGDVDGETLRGRLGLHPRGAADFFDALTTLGFVDRDDRCDPPRYRNTTERRPRIAVRESFAVCAVPAPSSLTWRVT